MMTTRIKPSKPSKAGADAAKIPPRTRNVEIPALHGGYEGG